MFVGQSVQKLQSEQDTLAHTREMTIMFHGMPHSLVVKRLRVCVHIYMNIRLSAYFIQMEVAMDVDPWWTGEHFPLLFEVEGTPCFFVFLF